MTRQVVARRVTVQSGSELAGRLGQAVLDLLTGIPASTETRAPGPDQHARRIAQAAASKAALAAGTLALPPGALGWLTLVPELVAIWRIQAQMVADIAAAHGKSAELGREQMLYCLFRHAAAQALRDVVVQVGGRVLIQEIPARALERIARTIGVKLSQRLLGRGIARWLPLIGAMGVGAYAWVDTRQVARNAAALFAPADVTAAP
ncbi:MAG TPA: hypothetical protein VFG55_04815 [Rhodanobacteraceae bacterium]|nr:hypothetical protein [Rhodanobacteraceae bacterium]